MSTYHLQGLEDQFDRKSRRRLDAFIVPEGAGSVFKQSEKFDENEVQAVQHSTLDENTTFYYVSHPSDSSSEVEEHRALTRLPILVIFHGIAHERGVPPSFTGSLTCLVSSATT
jgi:KUP system potassium uptake protein